MYFSFLKKQLQMIYLIKIDFDILLCSFSFFNEKNIPWNCFFGICQQTLTELKLECIITRTNMTKRTKQTIYRSKWWCVMILMWCKKFDILLFPYTSSKYFYILEPALKYKYQKIAAVSSFCNKCVFREHSFIF